MTTDSFAGGHPGMPQDSSKFEDNLIYSNNFNIFSDDRDEYCKQPPEDRDPTVVCPTFQVPVGTGILIAGGNDNIVEGNYIFDNWRRGTMLHWVPASLRGETDPAKSNDTSNNNAYVNNCMGIRPKSLWMPNHNTCRATATQRGGLLVGRGGGHRLRPGPARLRRHRDAEGQLLERATSGPDGAQPTGDPPCRPAGVPGSRQRLQAPELGQVPRAGARARRGIPRPTRTRPGATGSRPRPSRG